MSSPQEDESALAAMVPLSFLHGVYFPKRLREFVREGVFHEQASDDLVADWTRALVSLHGKMAALSGGSRQLIKNPAHTARIAELRRIFPGAQFVQVLRNPYEVLPSMKNFYLRLMEQYALQPFADAPIEDVVLETYRRMMGRAITDVESLPASDYVEVRFENLVEEPEKELAKIYDALNIPGSAEGLAGARAYLEQVRGYRQNKLLATEREDALVDEHWGQFVERWQYRRPSRSGRALERSSIQGALAH